jgi:membrane-associated phospholipid phosphatase
MMTHKALLHSLSICLHSVAKRFATPFHCLMGITLAVLIAGDMIFAQVVHLGGLSQLFAGWQGLLLLVGALCYCIWRSFPRLIETCQLAIWAVLMTNTLSLLIQIAGRSPRPLIDHALDSMDARVHFSTSFFVHLVARAPLVEVGLDIIYFLLPPLIIAAILIPTLCGRSEAARRYVLGIVIAAIITAALSALWPAVGPWTIQDIKPTQEQVGVAAYLIRLKSSAPVELDMNNAGIVSFPSFHVVLAILSAVALSSIRRLRAWAWALAALICISAITTGWHYGIDILGGLILAIITMITTSRIPRACHSSD